MIRNTGRVRAGKKSFAQFYVSDRMEDITSTCNDLNMFAFPYTVKQNIIIIDLGCNRRNNVILSGGY